MPGSPSRIVILPKGMRGCQAKVMGCSTMLRSSLLLWGMMGLCDGLSEVAGCKGAGRSVGMGWVERRARILCCRVSIRACCDSVGAGWAAGEGEDEGAPGLHAWVFDGEVKDYLLE